jgi:negative regulator of flagellin synthesis FlgM
MTIESITSRTHMPLTSKTSQKAEIDSEKSTIVKNPQRDDSIAITAMAQGIKKAFASSPSVAIVDVDRVTAVKKALADGNYQISAERIAKKMMQYEKLMPENDRI